MGGEAESQPSDSELEEAFPCPSHLSSGPCKRSRFTTSLWLGCPGVLRERGPVQVQDCGAAKALGTRRFTAKVCVCTGHAWCGV